MMKKALLVMFLIVLICALVLAGCAPTPSPAPAPTPSPTPAPAKIAWRLSHQYAPGYSTAVLLDRFVKAVKERSNGALEIQVFPVEQLIKLKDALDALEKRIVEMAIVSGTQVGIKIDAAFEMPGLFPTYESERAAIEGEVGQLMRQELAKYNTVPLDYVTTGHLHLFIAKKVIKTPADLKGMKIRVVSKELGTFIEICGAGAVYLSSSELYLALQTGVIDGVCCPGDTFQGRKLEEVAKYMTAIDLGPSHSALSVNKDALDGLSPNLRQIVEATAREIVGAEWIKSCYAADELGRKTLLGAGGQIYTPSSDEAAAWKAAYGAAIDKWAAENATWAPSFLKAVRKYSG